MVAHVRVVPSHADPQGLPAALLKRQASIDRQKVELATLTLLQPQYLRYVDLRDRELPVSRERLAKLEQELEELNRQVIYDVDLQTCDDSGIAGMTVSWCRCVASGAVSYADVAPSVGGPIIWYNLMYSSAEATRWNLGLRGRAAQVVRCAFHRCRYLLIEFKLHSRHV